MKLNFKNFSKKDITNTTDHGMYILTELKTLQKNLELASKKHNSSKQEQLRHQYLEKMNELNTYLTTTKNENIIKETYLAKSTNQCDSDNLLFSATSAHNQKDNTLSQIEAYLTPKIGGLERNSYEKMKKQTDKLLEFY